MQLLHDQLHDVVEILHTLFPSKVAEFITSHHHHEVEELFLSNRLSAAFDSQPALEREFSFVSTPRVSTERHPSPNHDRVHYNLPPQDEHSTLISSSSSGDLSTREDWNRFMSLVKHHPHLRADRRIHTSSSIIENRSHQVVWRAAAALDHYHPTDWL